MKHHLRNDKTCLNCGAEVTGRYCGNCGQENIEPKQTFGGLVHHFIGDITHYDSKFFTTLKHLLFKPGFLTRQYIAGRRNSYLDPIRMYVFISVVFFLALFFKKKEEPINDDGAVIAHYNNLARQHIADSLRGIIKDSNITKGKDSIKAVVIKSIAASLDSSVYKDTTESISFHIGNGGVHFELVENRFNNVAEYDSFENTLQEDKRDKGFFRWMLHTNISLKSRYCSRGQLVLDESFEHNIPKLMFVLLPLFALFIYWFHSRKKYYYVRHVIFSMHFHSFTFVLFLLITVIGWLFPHINSLLILTLPSLFILFVYLAVALKNTYHQSFLKAVLKTLTIGLMYVISLLICIIGLAFINFFTA